MRLLFRQRLFSLLDSYDIYDESGATVFTVKGKFSIGHKLRILDSNGTPVGMVRQVLLSFLARFDFYQGDCLCGRMRRTSFFHPKYDIDCNGWQVSGNLFQWNYIIKDAYGTPVVAVSKELFHTTDTYVIDVAKPEDALMALMVVLAIDAERCSCN